MQSHFEIEGFYSVKVTPLGAHLCLLEELDEDFIKGLTGEGEVWWKRWFVDIGRWKDTKVDNNKAMWVRDYGIPCHGWNKYFFVTLENSSSYFICLDDNTSNGVNLDVASILLRVLI